MKGTFEIVACGFNPAMLIKGKVLRGWLVLGDELWFIAFGLVVGSLVPRGG